MSDLKGLMGTRISRFFFCCCFFLSGKMGFGLLGVGITNRKNNEKWEWDWDLVKNWTGKMGLEQTLGLEMGFVNPLPPPLKALHDPL